MKNIKSKIESEDDILKSVIHDKLIAHFGEENYDWDDNHKIIIRYPEITIKNANGRSHLIRELYMMISMEIKSGKLYLKDDLVGTRGVLEYLEYKNKYAHSHLKKEAVDGFKSFCLGDSELQRLIGTIAFRGISIEDTENFDAFLITLNELASWESLSGVPYRYLERAMLKPAETITRQRINNTDKRNAYERFLELYKHREFDLDTTINITDDIIEIDKKKLSKILSNCTHLVGFRNSSQVYQPIDETKIESNRKLQINEKFNIFFFKGKEIKQKILPYKAKKEKTVPKELIIANPNIVDSVINEIVEDIYRVQDSVLGYKLYYENEKNNKKYTEINNRTQSIFRNSIPVFES